MFIYILLLLIVLFVLLVKTSMMYYCNLQMDNFLKPVKERTRLEKSVVIRFWRARGKFTADTTGKILLYDNKRVSVLYI